MKRRYVLAALFLLPFLAAAENFAMLDFEDEAFPATCRATRGQVSRSDRHHLAGRYSLRWDFQPGGKLVIPFAPWYLDDAAASRAYRPGSTSLFLFAAYAEKPLPGKKFRIGFGRRGKPDACWFEASLDFTGWRRAFVSYLHHMKGKPDPAMDEIRIYAPSDASGTLYFDDLIPCDPYLDRYQEGDRFVPLESLHPATRASNPLLFDRRRPTRTAPLTPAETAAFRKIEEQLAEQAFPAAARAELRDPEVHRVRLYKNRKAFEALRIRRVEDRIDGPPMNYGILRRQYERAPGHAEVLAGFIELRSVGSCMRSIAQLYLTSDDPRVKEILRNRYLLLFDYLTDQGYTDGSSLGSRALIGYSTRELVEANLLMRDVLREAGRLDLAARTEIWHHNVNACLDPATWETISADYFNIESRGALTAILLLPDSPAKAAYLAAFRRFVDAGLRYAPGWNSFTKPDGCAYHHWGHYPSYAFGGMSGAATLLLALRDTPYALSPEAAACLKQTLWAAHIYCNPHTAPALEGRVPFRNLSFGAPQETLRRLADAGDADAARWLAEDPQGSWSFNYGGFGIHRHGGRMVVFKTFNRYVWGSEIYADCNRYGRYLSYGGISILGRGTPAEEGRTAAGWDWNRWPGTTALHRPWERLDSPSVATEMRTLPDNRVNGASDFFHRCAMMGSIVTEPAAKRYDPAFRAVQSAFAFDDRIVALGSGISASEADAPVETTLFQYALGEGPRAGFFNSPDPRAEIPLDLSAAAPGWTMDFLGSAWFVMKGGTLRFQRRVQESPRQNDRKMQSAPFAAAVIDHGIRPKNAGYEYFILLGRTPEEAARLFASLPAAKPYTVLRCDDRVHAVRDHATGVTGIVAFAPGSFDFGDVASVDRPGVYLMSRREGDQLKLSVNTPDLAGFVPRAGGYTDLETKPGSEAAERADRIVRVRLRGAWKLVSGDAEAKPGAETTELVLRFRHGIPKPLVLTAGR